MLAQAAHAGRLRAAEGGIERDFRDGADGEPAPAALDAATGLRLRVVMAVPEPPGAAPRYLQLMQAVPVNLASNAEVLRTAYSEYQAALRGAHGPAQDVHRDADPDAAAGDFRRHRQRLPDRRQPGAAAAGAGRGHAAVAEGDLSPRPIVETNDELGTLTQSFNAMTGQLFEARSAVERNRAALQSAKAHLESVLANMSAGVIVLDADGVRGQLERGRAPHPAGRRRRRWPAVRSTRSRAWKRLPAPSRAPSRRRARSRPPAAARQRTHWQQQIEIPRRAGTGDDHDITLLARGSRLPVGAGSGFIVVFDDISDVISAQRSVAWGEVARRLAHEIKNPLTPIQLSAERLQMKLDGRVDAGRRRAAEQGAPTTIVNQVDAMKRMVDDFRDYAQARRRPCSSRST